MKASDSMVLLVAIAVLGAGGQVSRAAESASEDVLSRIARAQELNRREAGQVSDEDWDFIRSEVDRGRGSNVVDVLTEILRQGKSERTMAAIADLGKIGPAAALAVPALMEHFEEMENWDDFRAFYVSDTLQKMGSAASNAVAALISAIQERPALRATAAEALGGIGRPASNAIPVLKGFVQSSDGALAFAALNALARIEEDPTEYLPDLIRELDVPRERNVVYATAMEAMATFEALGPAARAAIPGLIRQLDHPTDDHVKAAARALGAMRAHGAPAEKKLRAVEGSERYEMETRIVAAAALGKIMGGLYDAPKRVREIREAEKQRQEEHWNRLTRRYERFTSKLPDVTRIELSAISMATNGLPSSMKRQTFPIRPYSDEARVHSQTNLAGIDALEIAKAWRNLDFGVQYSGLCHYPAYGLRFFSGKRLLLETSVCWSCSNFYVGKDWVGFNAESASAKALLEQLEEILPATAEPKNAEKPASD